LSGQALPAVTVPSGSKAGLSVASTSTVVPGRGPSSLVTSVPSASVTGTISRSKWLLSTAATARCCEIAAHSSWVSRVTLQRLATFSAVMPIGMQTLNGAPSEPSSRGCGSNGGCGGKRETASTPAATYWSPSPASIAWKAIRSACSEDEQKRLIVTAGT
jgi:hypothetical protein